MPNDAALDVAGWPDVASFVLAAPRKQKLTPAEQAEIDRLTQWTHVLAGFAGLIRAAGDSVQLAYGSKNPDLAQKIMRGLHALFMATQSVNEAFNNAIKDIEAHKPFETTAGPDTIPDWPDDTGNADIVDAAWTMLKPILETAIGKLGKTSLIAVALAQFIADSDKILDELRPLFSSASASG